MYGGLDGSEEKMKVEKPKITPLTEIIVDFKEYLDLLAKEKAWKRLRRWASKNPHGSVWTTDVLNKMTEILKQCKKQEGE